MDETERWVDIEDPIDQFEAALGIKFERWQRDWLEHYGKGEKLVPKGKHGSQWVPREE